MECVDIIRALKEFWIPGKGFVYQKGFNQPQSEATVWACLASLLIGEKPDYIEAAISWLKSMQNDDGSVNVNSIGTGQTVWAAAQFAILMNFIGESDSLKKARDFLMQAKGETFEQHPFAEQDNSIVGWAWTKDSFSWVEPTAWALIGLKNSSYQASDRFRDGVRLLVDRMIPGNGWNCGVKNVYSTDLIPFVDTTALALLALHDQVEFTSVAEVFEVMETTSLTANSVYALAMTVLVMKKYKRDFTEQRNRLVEFLGDGTEIYMNSHHLAFASIALAEREIF
ncbi:MAG: hypothetical protein PWR01_4352 [Clostridiales bacterium]|jgi:hypothetical protein|nr:hypothetical protein [Clostridiales bacterium]MDN5283279.1 hypothetical protein [Candidatus Ozemobacter sp.]